MTTAYAPLDIIHRPHPAIDTLSRLEAEDWLLTIAEALSSGWHEEMSVIADTPKWIRRNHGIDPTEALLAAFRASEADNGVCKSAVIINHQWVLKLGENAEFEAETYCSVTAEDRSNFVPTVGLDDSLGCLQLKVPLPELNAGGYLFTNDAFEEDYQRLIYCFSDCHRGNVGIWHNRLVAIDFAGSN